MKRIILLICLFLSFNSHASPLVHFRVSKPLCVLNFLQAASGNSRSMSPTLTSYIRKNISVADSEKFYGMLQRFSALDLDHSYTIPAYPENRQKPRTTLNLITIAAVQATDINDFTQRIIGMLPNEQWMQFKAIMVEAAPYYEQLLELPFAKPMRKQLYELEKYNNQLDDVFNRLKRFYGSTWNQDIPFTIGIYPIPGKKGTTTATPHSNSLVLAVLTEERNYAMRVAVAMHEICHVLYEEQPLALQQQLDTAFTNSTLPGSSFAYSYIDEALATACGNAWVYHELTGKEDTGSWYNDAYIDGYAHALYPLVKSYLDGGLQMDRELVTKAIAIFHERFPTAHLNYQNLLNKMHFYTDAKDHQEFGMINGSINKYFRVSSSYSSYPIADAQSVAGMDGVTGTLFYIVHHNHHENFKVLKKMFPQLNNIGPKEEGIISFVDAKQRAIIILNVKDVSRVDKGLQLLLQEGSIKTDKVFTAIK